MLKKFWVLPMLLMLPTFSTAAGPQAPLKFFDSIPGQDNSIPQSRSSVSSKANDILWETWTVLNLQDGDINDMKLPTDPALRSQMIQQLIQFRSANRAAGSESPQQDLQSDLQWAERVGFPISNANSLSSFEETMSKMTDEQRLQYAQRVPGEIGQILLQGVLNGTPDPELALRFLTQNPKAVSPERRDTLIFKNFEKLSDFGSRDPSKNNVDMSLVRKASSLLNFQSPHTICRTAANAVRVEDLSGKSNGPREYNEIMARGLIEMTKRNLDCHDYTSNERFLFMLAKLEQENFYGRGFFMGMIKKLQGAEDSKSSSSPQMPTLNPTLNQCLVDKTYSDFVKVEFNKMDSAGVGSINMFGAKSKGDCSLRVQVQKLKAGFDAYIILSNSVGATLLQFNQKFKTLEQMKNAAIFGTKPD